MLLDNKNCCQNNNNKENNKAEINCCDLKKSCNYCASCKCNKCHCQK